MTRANMLLLLAATLTGAGLSYILSPARQVAHDGPVGVQRERRDDRADIVTIDREGLGSLLTQIDALRGEVAAMRNELAQRRATEGLPVAAATAPRLDDKIESEEEWTTNRQVAMNSIQQQFSVQTRDPRWANPMTSKIRESIGRLETVRDSIRDVDCRSTTCRVEISADTNPRLTQELEPAVMSLASSFPSIEFSHTQDPNGRKTVVLYMHNAQQVESGS